MTIGIRYFGTGRALQGPMTPPLGATGNPLPQNLDFPRAERFALCVMGRHPNIGVVSDNARHQFTGIRLPRNNDSLRATVRIGILPLIESQSRLAMRLVRTVAVKAAVREKRKHIAAELNFGYRQYRGAHEGLDNQRCCQ
jgi:hypothetical protein